MSKLRNIHTSNTASNGVAHVPLVGTIGASGQSSSSLADPAPNYGSDGDTRPLDRHPTADEVMRGGVLHRINSGPSFIERGRNVLIYWLLMCLALGVLFLITKLW